MSESGSAGESETMGGGAGASPTSDGASAGEAGAGGSAGSAPIGEGGAAETSSPRWFAFSRSTGNFAYDTAQFPSDAGLVSLGSGSPARPPIWSPDGHWLLTEYGSDLYRIDMSGAAPGVPILLSASGPGMSIQFPALSWSADSKTVAMTKATSTTQLSPQVLVFDPTHPEVGMQTLSTAAKSLLWAPVGDRVLYRETNGTHVRRVQAGSLGPELLLDGDSFLWSPDGKSVAAVAHGELMLTDVTQPTPTAVMLSNGGGAWSTVDQVVFSADGDRVLFAGQQLHEFQKDLFMVRLKPTVGAPIHLSTGLTSNDTISDDFSMSPDGKWVLYSVFDSNDYSAWAVNLSGTEPGAPFKVASMPIDASSWVPNAPGKYIGYGSAGLAMLDAANPGLDGVKLEPSGGGAFSLSSRGAIVFGGITGSFAYDLIHPELPSVPLAKPGNTFWSWAPDGSFIALVDSAASSPLRLVHWANSTASAPLALGAISGVGADSVRWQPVSH